MRTLTTTLLRLSLVLAILGGAAALGRTARAEGDEFVFAQTLPAGVAFRALASATAPEFRFHAAGMVLQRYTLDCSQATGKLFAMEQLLFVEWGAVEVHDWASGESLTTLTAGDTFAPTQEEDYVYLTGAQGRMASVLRFGTTAASVGDPSVLPDATFESTGCRSGLGGYAPVEATPVTTLFEEHGEKARDFAGGGGTTMYLGVLTVELGAGFFAVDADHHRADTYTSTGTAIFAPLVGGLGSATSGGVGYGEVPAGANPALFPGMTLGGLVNEGGWPVTVLVAGTTPAGNPPLDVTG